MELREQKLTRYILPLREGGSLPGLAEADDGFHYAVKMKGSGHGAKSLVSELIGGMTAKAFKLKVPELVLLYLSPLFGITEPDYEVQQLLRKSEGINLGLHFLDRAMTFDPYVNHVDPHLASKIVWFDSFIENIDRTRQNPNMMMWSGELWLIDHGSSLYFQHGDKTPSEAARDPFPFVKNHVLLPQAAFLEETDRKMRQAITPRTLNKIVDLIPEEWLTDPAVPELDAPSRREYYKEFLTERLRNSSVFTEQAMRERDNMLNMS